MLITNEKDKKISLAKRFTDLMSISERLDMLVGFFFFSGIQVMSEGFRSNPDLKLRVLVGMDAEQYCGKLVEIAYLEREGNSNDIISERFQRSLRKIVGSETVDTESFQSRIGLFIELLETGRLEMRKTREPNHAKLYIFSMNEKNQKTYPKIWLTGSSNFSAPGLEMRNELNVDMGAMNVEEASGFYEKLWEDAVPLTEDETQRKIILDILKDNSVAAMLTPFEAYYLILKNYVEYQQQQLNMGRLDRILESAGFTKYKYQVDAVAQAMMKLNSYHGVLIADVVGLGKSVIAGMLGALRGKRALLIVPPGLIGNQNGRTGGWWEYVNKFRLTDWRVFSRGNLNAVLELLETDPDFDMVVIDEAHYFRNEDTQDYERLSMICRGREVVLLTATPFNNRPSDLLALLHLFSPGQNSPLLPGGELDLRFKALSSEFKNASGLYRAIAKKDFPEIQSYLKKCRIELLAEGASDLPKIRAAAKKFSEQLNQEIRRIMEKVTIRRNRIDLTGDPDYAKEITTLSKVQPPKEQFFELTREQDNFYDCVIKRYFGEGGEFHGAIYQPEYYYKKEENQDIAQTNIYKMMQRMLVARFESSFGAFQKSLENAKRMMLSVKKFIERMKCYLYSREDMEKIMACDDELEASEMLNEITKKLEETQSVRKQQGVYYMNGPNFDSKQFKKDLDSDIELFDFVLQDMKRLKLVENDPKCEKLIATIRDVLDGTHSDVLSEGAGAPKRKVIVFTMYTDTLNYIADLVKRAFPDKVLAISGGNYNATADNQLKSNFDASFATQRDDYDILLATDKLSEGFNLNRAGIIFNYDIPWNPTRTIQRVGRINRIGKKVFENLYIFNFFPTVKGSTINQNREVAQNKMFAIHNILGEDAQIFSVDEEPSASALFDKLCRLDSEEEESSFARLKRKFREADAQLTDEERNRIKRLSSMVKTAFNGLPEQTILFKRQGPGFFAIAYDQATREVREIDLEKAVDAVECTKDTPRIDFTDDFWDRKESKQKIDGIYTKLKKYTPEIRQQQNTPTFLGAIGKLRDALPTLDRKLYDFAEILIDDLLNYKTLSVYTLKSIANANSEAELKTIISNLRARLGVHYLQRIKDSNLKTDIIVTVQKHPENGTKQQV